jgi:starch synthase (maltosyl-transferring)
VPKPQARRCLQNVLRYLVVPGALGSLAPRPGKKTLPIHGPDWRLLNDPPNPYWPRYQGDEDTQRKPAYHNGTAWTWTFPGLCEAIARTWGCVGQIPELLDGDAPHTQRGCDAQAWSVTEALRVWKLLNTR